MADNNLGTYNPEELTAVITVPDHPEVTHVLSGWVEGTMFTFEKTTPSSTIVRGADNTGGRVRRSTRAGMFTFSLHQFTASNDFMSWLERADANADDNSWAFNLTVKDGLGRSFFQGTQCFISQTPVVTLGVDGTDTRDWVVEANNVDFIIGGNAKIPSEIYTVLEAMGATIPDAWKIN